MARLVVAAVLIAVVAAVAVVLERRRRAAVPAPRDPAGYRVPQQLDRADFDRPDAPWLVAVFSSASCLSCTGTWEKVRHLASEAVAVQDVEVGTRRDLHERYGVDAVPMVLVVDAAGVVRASFMGPPTATDLWATVAELREPGSTPAACDHHQSAPED